jgi:hypothetical protein
MTSAMMRYRTAQTGQSGQGTDRSAWTGQPDRTVRTRCQHNTAWTELWGQYAGDQSDGAGQLGQNRRLDRQTEQAGHDKIARGDSRDSTARKGNRGQNGQNMTARTGKIGEGNWDGTTIAGQPRYGIWDRTI